MTRERNARPDKSRRAVLKGAVASGLAGLSFAGSTWSWPALAAVAPGWPDEAFKQKAEADAIKTLYGKTAEASDQVKLDAPEIAENGAVVPIAVSCSLPGVTSISILVAENPYALAASYKIPEGTSASVANRLKMAKTTKVVALVEAGGKLYSAQKEVKVTVGGCGG